MNSNNFFCLFLLIFLAFLLSGCGRYFIQNSTLKSQQINLKYNSEDKRIKKIEVRLMRFEKNGTIISLKKHIAQKNEVVFDFAIASNKKMQLNQLLIPATLDTPTHPIICYPQNGKGNIGIDTIFCLRYDQLRSNSKLVYDIPTFLLRPTMKIFIR
jgi:hypothetical protein